MIFCCCCPVTCVDLTGTAPAALVPASLSPATPKAHSASLPRPQGSFRIAVPPPGLIPDRCPAPRAHSASLPRPQGSFRIAAPPAGLFLLHRCPAPRALSSASLPRPQGSFFCIAAPPRELFLLHRCPDPGHIPHRAPSPGLIPHRAPPRPQRSTGGDVRSLVGCRLKETLHCCRVTSVVFSDACSDST